MARKKTEYLTEKEILEDEDIWRVTEESDDEELDGEKPE